MFRSYWRPPHAVCPADVSRHLITASVDKWFVKSYRLDVRIL